MAEQVKMVFQPIFDKTMHVFAYEGLMRFTDTTIVKVINECKSYSDFYEIEKLTFFKALQEYQKRNYKEKLFINSFPHVHLSKTDLSEIISHHKDTLNKVVIEILEYPDLDRHRLSKRKMM